MLRLLSLFFGFFPVLLSAQQSLPPIGDWREHLPYNSAIDCAAGDGQVFCATPYSLFSVSVPGNEVERLSRVSGLAETGISRICYDATGKKLIIAYSNSNLDIIYRNDIYNVPDIKRALITGDKTINQIYPLNDRYYLSTGLGVVVVDGSRYEIRDTWLIGNNGGQVKVNGFSSDAGFFYAATEEGLKRTALNTVNPANYINWTVLSGSNGLTAGAVKNVVNVQGKIIAQKNDSLFVLNGSNWTFLYADTWPFISIRESEGSLLICERQLTGSARVVILKNDGTVSRTLPGSAVLSFPRQALLLNNEPWLADQFGALSHYTSGNSFVNYKPNSPQGISSGEMLVYNKIFYATAGAVNDSWNYQFDGDGVFQFSEGSWNNINRYQYTAIDTLLDYVCIAADPRDNTIWAGSFGGGLLHIKAGPAFEIFKKNYLGETLNDPGSYRVAGLAFDAAQNLWVSNFGSVQPLRVRKADGSWKNFTLPFNLTENALAQIVIDPNGYKWIQAPLGNGLICFDDNQTPDNTGDDHWKRFGSGAGNGNLPGTDVLSVAVDKDGAVWVGTNDGVGLLQCGSELFSSTGCDASWPVVPNGNFAGYLFKGQSVRSIAVDGANRKWMATRNGVFLVNATGDKVIYQFTEDNSPLLSNDVKKIAIDGTTGEVYFATLKGICSFRSTATEGTEKNEDVLVFPNPVPPGYSGTIGIRGLAENAVVKITEMDGRLVYQTRALGGQAVWDGKDYKGNRISTGVYLVLVSNDGHSVRTATRIVFVQR